MSERLHEEAIGEWLDRLASAAPTPGGGAAAALHAAMAAALLEMTANLTVGKDRFRQQEETLVAARAEAGQMRGAALDLAAEDVVAFAGVIAAYRLPRGTDAERAERTRQVQAALGTAAAVPSEVAALAERLVVLCERIIDLVNPQVVSDIAVAAASARAALESAIVNIEINRVALTDPAVKIELQGAVQRADEAAVRAAATVAAVRRRIVG
jgi:formiminotetrahydrofolate cyclodeaminase